MSTSIPQRRCAGTLFGLAFGDALGAASEFLDVQRILARFPPDGPRDLSGDPARVTDDTQMALAVGEALLAVPLPYTPALLEPALRKTFVAWSRSPENTRAPGQTCLQACANLEQGLPWPQATLRSSKGCGANMRVAPVGLLPLEHRVDAPRERAALAQFQAAMTHGHPTALAASDLTAAAIADLLAGGDPPGLLHRLRSYALSQRMVYHADWLGPLWMGVGVSTPQEYIARGWDECLHVLERLEQALRAADYRRDPCRLTGAGWVAEEAFATGLLCFLLFPDDPLAAVHHGAVTSGDSDTIACLAGAFAGAHLGLDAWPGAWIERIEYAETLARLGRAWERPAG